MEIEAKILYLVTKKLANETNEDELKELNSLLLQNPNIADSLKNIIALWDNIDLEITISEKEINENIADALKKIHQQITKDEKPGSEKGE